MTPRNRTLLWAAVAALCLLHSWMAASVSRYFSTTVDEVVHLTAGYAYGTTGDFRLQPENGNFPQRWCALPLLFRDVKFPPRSGEAWEQADVWRVGQQFFYESGNDLPSLLAAGRAMNSLLAGLLCFVIFLLARSLFGTAGGMIALLLATFSPTLLAHGGLVTSDTAAGLGFALATLTWIRLQQRITVMRVLLAGGALGLLALSKYSVVLFGPVVLVTIGSHLVRRTGLALQISSAIQLVHGRQKVAALAISSLLAVSIAVVLIWAAYGFRYSAIPPGQSASLKFAQPWDSVLLKSPANPPMTMADGHALEPIDLTPGILQSTVAWARDHRLLPEAYLYGFAFVAKHSRGRLAYFAGDYRLTGWIDFFPTAFALKTTLPALALIGLGFIGLGLVPSWQRRVWIYRAAPLLTLFVVYWAFALTSHLNIGHRHLLPIYLVCYTLAGGSILLLVRHRGWAAPIVALLLWHAGDSLTARPDYLAYFNSMAGGPAEAHRLFVDSSLDWGQDLPRLRRWLEANAGKERIFLSYFGSGDPAREGIVATRFGDNYFDWGPRQSPPALRGGIYAISATMLHRVYTHVRGPWSAGYEVTYQKLLPWMDHARAQSRDQTPTDLDGSPLPVGVANARRFNYEQLQFGRLCHYLEHRPPDARAGYSILIFHLTDEEVKKALYQTITDRPQ